MPVFLLLNFLIMPSSDSLVIELDPAANPSFHREIEAALTNPNLTDLTIRMEANNQWIVFGSPPKLNGVSLEVDEFTYSIKHEVGGLPERIGHLDSLQSLKVEFLGLSSLPNSIVHLSKLQELDISFNKLKNLEEELDKLSKIPLLKHLKIYGCGFSKTQIEYLQQRNPKLEIYYTSAQFSEEHAPK